MDSRECWNITISRSSKIEVNRHLDKAMEEEQEQELEALSAIFANDFKVLEEPTSQHGARFSLSISDPALSIDAKLIFSFPTSYPSEIPQIVLHSISGIPSSQRTSLVSHLRTEAEGMIGEPMIFALHGAAKEWLVENGGKDVDEAGGEDGSVFETRDEDTRMTVETVHSKVIGTPVTVDSFMKWREGFMKEMGYRLDDDGSGGCDNGDDDDEEAKKLTGKEIFEQGNDVIDEDNEDFWTEQAELYDA